MKPLYPIVVALLVVAANAHPDNIEAIKELPQTKEPVVEAQESTSQARKERCTACSGHSDIVAALKNLPKGEVHTQQSFEGCSSDKGCAGIKVKDGKVIEKFGNLDAFNKAQSANAGNEFQFHAAGSEVFDTNGPFWWMNQNSPFKTDGTTFQKFSKQTSSSFTSSGDLSGNPFLNGDFSKLSGGFTSAGSNGYAGGSAGGSAFQSSAKQELDITKNPFLSGGFSAQGGFGGASQNGFASGASGFNSASQSGYGGASQGGSQGGFGGSQGGSQGGFGGSQGGYGSQSNFNSFSSTNKFSSNGYTGSSPTPFTASTAGSNINLIQNTQKASEYDYQQQSSIDDGFQNSGNVQAQENSAGDFQQTCSGQGYVCVNKAQCNNGVVNANGGALLQANTQKQYCNVRSEICCRIETSSLSGAGNLQGSLGVGSATYNGQGSSLFSGSSNSNIGAGFGQTGYANTNKFASNFGSNFEKGQSSFGSTPAPGSFGSTQSNFIETDSFSASSDNSGLFRPGGSGSGLKPGIPYLPPVDSSTSGTNVVSTGYPTPTFVTTPRPFTTPRPITPRPTFTTPKPTYLPPKTSTSAPEYLPPDYTGQESIRPPDWIDQVPPYTEGKLYLEGTIPSSPGAIARPPPGPSPNDIPAGCAAALKCTPIEFCTAEGVISTTSVILTREQEAYRVPLTDCKDLGSGRIGKCCRDPLYTDPWPTNQLGKWVPGVFGGNDGKYVPDSGVSSNNPRPGVTLRPDTTGSIIVPNFLTTQPPTVPYVPNQGSFPSTTPSSFTSQSQFGKGSYEQGSRGTVGIGGQGQYSQGSQGQFTQFGQGQKGVGQTVTQGSYGQGGRGQVSVIGQGQGVSQTQGFGASRGTGFGVTQGTGQVVRQGSGQSVSQGAGFGVTQGAGQVVRQGSGVGISQGAGFGVSQGAGQVVRQSSGQGISQGSGFGVTQGTGQVVRQGSAIGVGQGGGFGVTQGAGQVVRQGSGQVVSQGAGFGVSRGQGQTVTQGGGVGVITGQGQGVSQGQGFGVVRGQGQGVVQGFGQGVSQGQGSSVSQGSGFGVTQGQGSAVSQGSGFGVTQGQGSGVSQGSGFGLTQGQGSGVSQGSGFGVTQGQGTGVSQGSGFGVTQGQGFGVNQGQGFGVSQGGGFGVSQGQGQVTSQGGGFGVITGQGQAVSQGAGFGVTRGQGAIVSQGQGQQVSQGQGFGVSSGQGQGVSQGFGFGVSRGQGQTVSQGQGFGVNQGFGFGVLQGQGQGLVRGSGQTLIQGQGQKLTQGFGTGVKTGGGFTETKVENDYSESLQRVYLPKYGGNGECGLLNPQKPYGNHKELEADFAEIPWQAMVLLQTNRSLLCGGVITRPDVVVTTASCVEGLEAKNVLIKGGEWKLGIDDEPLPFQIVQVKHILRHPLYKSGEYQSDAAILVLSENLRLAKNIWPICLPSAKDSLDAFYNGAGECIVTGWGKQVLQAHLQGSIMHTLNVSLINPGECKAKISQDYPHLLEQYDQDSCVCGQPTNPLNNICRVDIGSALACTTGDSHYVLRGVYSWDSGCQTGNQLAAFYRFDLEWYEWAIGLTESVRFTQYSKVSKVTTGKVTKVKTTTITGGVKGSVTSGVKGFTTKGFESQGQGGQFGITGVKELVQGLGIEGLSQTGQFDLKGFKGTGKFGAQGQDQTGQFSQFGSQTGELKGQGQAGQFSQFGTSQTGEVQGPISKTFSATFSEKKFFQTEPKYVTYTTKPEIVTYTTKPEYFTYTTKPEIVTFTTKPEIVTYTTKPKIVTYTTKPEIVTYTTKPKIVTYTTKPQIVRYETSGTQTNSQYVSPGVSFKPSFTEIAGAKHEHNAKCKCLENSKK